ncbi:MAG TPA: Rossmann-like and DUF2520 domain-containing protein [Pyrinomonadaceae bacterium]|nr:Rossmann-like and DUF2520 domain-containing protein [Pyrinomonadaceae bacterium]
MPAKKRKEKPEVSIIGTGRLGTTLAVALEANGYSIRSLVARHVQSARRAAAFLVRKVETFGASQLSSVPLSNLVLITVPDDQIAKVAAQLATRNHDPSPTVLHTSGALSSEVLAPLRAKGWSTGSVHPLISVSDPQVSIEGAFWSVEGDARAVRIAKALVRDLGGTSFSIRTADKPLYHAAAVMTSGNVTALFDVALEMLVECGLTRETARRILQPLLVSTVQNLETKDPAAALTGTFSRGDVETVKRHLAALKEHKLADALELYCRLGKRSLEMTKKGTRITRILDGC